MSPEQALAFSKQKILRFGGSPGSGVGLASSWTASIISFSPPAIPRAVRSTRARSRTNTAVFSFQTTGTVLPMLPASAGEPARANKNKC